MEQRHELPTSARSEAALETLRRELASALGSLCPPALADRKDDLLQSAMIKIVELQRKQSAHAPLSASYLYRVAYTTLMDELRRTTARREVSLEELEPASPPAVASGDPERASVAAQIARGVRACLQDLVEDRRLAVTLHLQGHTIPEAAELLGWEPKRTENLIYRGLSALRTCLSTKGIEP